MDELSTEERVEILRQQIASMAELLDRLWEMLEDLCPTEDRRTLYGRHCDAGRKRCPNCY